MMKQQLSYLPGMEKMDSPKSVYLSDDQASCSSQTTSMSAPPSPHPENFPSSINILKAVLTGSQEVYWQYYYNTNILNLSSQVLPQYRTIHQPDRAKKKEKYEESLRLIQELIDCDDFEDISTLRVSGPDRRLFSSTLCMLNIPYSELLYAGCRRPVGPQLLRPLRQALPDWRQDCLQAGPVD